MQDRRLAFPSAKTRTTRQPLHAKPKVNLNFESAVTPCPIGLEGQPDHATDLPVPTLRYGFKIIGQSVSRGLNWYKREEPDPDLKLYS